MQSALMKCVDLAGSCVLQLSSGAPPHLQHTFASIPRPSWSFGSLRTSHQTAPKQQPKKLQRSFRGLHLEELLITRRATWSKSASRTATSSSKPAAMPATAMNEVTDGIKNMEVGEDGTVIFSTPGCPHCRRAKFILKENKIEYKEFDVGDNQAARAALLEATGRRTVPVVFLRGTYIGGADDVEELVKSGKIHDISKMVVQALPAPVMAILSPPPPMEEMAAPPAAAEEMAATTPAEEEVGNLVFSTPGCPHCKRAKFTLTENKIPYKDVDVGGNPEARAALLEATGRRTVPVVFLRGAYVGGADDVEELFKSGKLLETSTAAVQPLPPAIVALLAAPPAPMAMAEAMAPGVMAPAAEESICGIPLKRFLELEAIEERMLHPETGVKRSEHRVRLRTYTQSFRGATAVEWMRANLSTLKSAEEAIALGRELQSAKLLSSVTFSEPFDGSDELFRLRSNEPPFSKGLNAQRVHLKGVGRAGEVAQHMRERLLALYDKALSPDGSRVHYKVLRSLPEFREYVAATEELQRVDLFALSRDEKMAFFINCYNSLVIHAQAVRGPPASSLDRLAFFRNSIYHIGGHDYSLDDIENGVLRGNRPPASSLTGGRPFDTNDPRRVHAIVPMDPRIHFALNCGAKSCPPIKVFTNENVDEGLRGASEAFLEAEVEVDAEGKVVLSKIIDWYKGDFGATPEERVRWLKEVVSDEKKAVLERVLKAGDVKITFRPYDWGVNE